jgi:hypothetical protein
MEKISKTPNPDGKRRYNTDLRRKQDHLMRREEEPRSEQVTCAGEKE